jgi:hypothetical protein
VAPVALSLLLPSASAFVAFARLPTAAPRSCPVLALAPSSSLLADAVAGRPDFIASLQQFQDSHTILIAALSAIAVRVVVSEVRFRIERPVMDKVGEKARQVAGEKARELTPNTDQIGPVAWAKLAACIALDLAGDASALFTVLGEFTDLAYAPVEAGLLFALFKSFGMAQCAVAHSSPRRMPPPIAPEAQGCPAGQIKRLRRACWLYAGCMLAVCWLYTGCMLAVCWLYAGCMLAVCWLYAGCMLAVCWLPSGRALWYVPCRRRFHCVHHPQEPSAKRSRLH